MFRGKKGQFIAFFFISLTFFLTLGLELKAAVAPQKHFSNLIDDGSRLKRRTQEYAEHYGVRLIALEMKEKQKKSHGEFFQTIPVVMITEGDFHDVLVHFNRMALFSTSQKPLRLEIRAQPNGVVRFTTEIQYYRLGQFQPRSSDPMVQEEQWLRLQRAAKDLIKTQENGLLTLLIESLLEALPQEKTKLVIQKFSWSASNTGEIEFHNGNKKVYRRFRKTLKKQPYFQKVKWQSAKKSDSHPKITFELDRRELEKSASSQSSQNWRMAGAYSPLGRVNPFRELGTLVSPNPVDPKEFCKKLTLEDLTLLQADPGFMGFGRGAEIRLPDHRSLKVDLGAVISRYQGTVIRIEQGQIIIEEKFLNAHKQLVTHQTILTQKDPQ